jgi:phenylacetic acid degradation operon negative regulatory protein
MGGGSWLSPRSVAAETVTLMKGHGAHAFARVFAGRLAGPGADADLVAQCWDLEAIARRYDAFAAHYAPRYRRDRSLAARKALNDEAAFVTRFALTHDFRRFPFIDPDLPKELLPRNWAGARARALFEEYHALLRDGALRFFNRVARTG